MKGGSPTAEAASVTVAQMTHTVYEQTNQVRYNKGLHGYVRDARLDKVAMAWALQQWKNGAMSHNPHYSTQIPAGWTRAGENVASGYTSTQVVAAWVASPGHYANLVRDYTSIGIGFYEAEGRRYWVQTSPNTPEPGRPPRRRHPPARSIRSSLPPPPVPPSRSPPRRSRAASLDGAPAAPGSTARTPRPRAANAPSR